MSDDQLRFAFANLTDKTWIPLGATLAIVGAITTATWVLSGRLHQVETALRDAGRDRWTLTDQRDYANQMAAHNQAVARSDGKTGLLIPDPVEIRERTLKTQRN